MKNNFLDARPGAGRRLVGWCGAVVAGMAMASLAMTAGCSSKAENAPPASATSAGNLTLTPEQRKSIHVYTVAQSQFRKTIAATGAVDFDNDQATSVLAPFSGPVSRLLVAVGQRVKKGEPLAEVDSPDFAAAVGAYIKAIASAKNLHRLADADKDLAQHEGVSAREQEQAQTDAANADADSEAARLALVSLDADPQLVKDIEAGRASTHARAVVRAPIAGTVAEKLVTPGQLLQAGTTPCFTVADLSRVWVMAQIPDSDLASVRVGDAAQVETGVDASKLAGTVANISSIVDPDTRAVIARVDVDNPGQLLRKQMYVHVRIQSRQANSGLLVPVSAILRDDENLPFVYVVQADGSFARRPVTQGARTGDQVVIPTGLAIGDRIVDDGALFLQFRQIQ